MIFFLSVFREGLRDFSKKKNRGCLIFLKKKIKIKKVLNGQEAGHPGYQIDSPVEL